MIKFMRLNVIYFDRVRILICIILDFVNILYMMTIKGPYIYTLALSYMFFLMFSLIK